MCADETIVADAHVAISIVDIIVRQDRGTKRDNRVLPDVDSLRIGLIELGTQRDHGSFADVHFPDANQVVATDRHHDVTQRLTHPGR